MASAVRPTTANAIRTHDEALAFHSFCGDFKKHILAGKYNDADDLLVRNIKQWSAVFKEQKTFDGMLESLVVDSTNDKRHIQAIELCIILENRKLASDFSYLCHASCLINVGRLIEAKSMLQNKQYPLGFADSWALKCLELPDHEEGVVLFSTCMQFMNQAILVDQLCAEFKQHVLEKDYDKAKDLLTTHLEKYPVLLKLLVALKSFDCLSAENDGKQHAEQIASIVESCFKSIDKKQN